MARIRKALLSVSDKSGIVDLGRALVEQGVELLSTGGTCRALSDAGLPVTEIASYTGFPEMLSGRVKTLHPRVHGGLLGVRDDAEHRRAMEDHQIDPIDLVVVNLYPFEQTVARQDVGRAEAVEQIDIGGPAMVRSAAKNHRFVGIVTDPADYAGVVEDMRANGGELTERRRRALALKAFQLTARYDAAIAAWLFEAERAEGMTEEHFPGKYSLVADRMGELRYGENPHQNAAVYRYATHGAHTLTAAQVLNGKALSYNNYVDLDAALRIASEFTEPFACVVKHNNPCGAAQADELGVAIADAWAGDPISAFGSVLALNREVDLAVAEFLTSEQRFVEAIVAPGFAEDAFELLTTKPKWGRNVRLLSIGKVGPDARAYRPTEVKPISGGFLVQDLDRWCDTAENCRVVTRAEPTSEQLHSLLFANRIAKHVKSNAIVVAKGTRVLGVGAGQMSRVDSVRLACDKAGDQVQGAVLAGDAFFPFPDGPELAMDRGVAALLQPGGSMRDEAVIAACDAREVPMVFSGHRHFRH
jgi:phosphoribosylaminoimidazolecarboxamide formyltransferase/IMP cyclohydrolase